MAVASDELVRLCDKLCDSDDARLSHLLDAVAVVRERLQISSAKADGGTTGEMWIAKHFGLKWESESKTGADAADAEGRPCEIKASLHPLKTKLKTHKTNICYKTPHRKDGEDDDAFVARTQEHIRKNTGGHFWATWVEKTPKDADDRIILRWWVPSGPLAQLIGKKMHASKDMARKNAVIAINFGAKVCLTCGGVHRIDGIVGTLGGWNGRTEDGAVLRARQGAHTLLATVNGAEGVPADVIAALDVGICASQCG